MALRRESDIFGMKLPPHILVGQATSGHPRWLDRCVMPALADIRKGLRRRISDISAADASRISIRADCWYQGCEVRNRKGSMETSMPRSDAKAIKVSTLEGRSEERRVGKECRCGWTAD